MLPTTCMFTWFFHQVPAEDVHRRHPHPHTALDAVDDDARTQGAHTLGLSVFDFNTSARSLYESLGYETTMVKMRKHLV